MTDLQQQIHDFITKQKLCSWKAQKKMNVFHRHFVTDKNRLMLNLNYITVVYNWGNNHTLVQTANWIFNLQGSRATKVNKSVLSLQLSSKEEKRAVRVPPLSTTCLVSCLPWKNNGVYSTSITPLILLPSYIQRPGLQPDRGRRLRALMWEPGANGSAGYCKVMKSLHFYNDVNDVAWESKKSCESSTMSIYGTWMDGRGRKTDYMSPILNIYTLLITICR